MFKSKVYCSKKEKDNCILGEGNFGVVRKIFCKKKRYENNSEYCNGREYVAKKVIKINPKDFADFMLREEIDNYREVEKILKELEKYNSPNIIKMYKSTLETLPDRILVTQYLEYINGGELYMYISSDNKYKNYNINDLKTPTNKANIIVGLFMGLKVIHDNNILHCDIKPENICIKKHSKLLIPVYIDFDLAKPFYNERDIETQGTIHYIRYDEREHCTPRSDILALMLSLLFVYGLNEEINLNLKDESEIDPSKITCNFGTDFGITEDNVKHILYYNQHPKLNEFYKLINTEKPEDTINIFKNICNSKSFSDAARKVKQSQEVEQGQDVEQRQEVNQGKGISRFRSSLANAYSSVFRGKRPTASALLQPLTLSLTLL